MSPIFQPSNTRLPECLQTLLEDGCLSDPTPREVLAVLDTGVDRQPNQSFAECKNRAGRFYYRGRLYIPDSKQLKAELLRRCHDASIAGNRGRARTYDLLS